ncbi:hypothetical protein Tco_0212946 [Tanacetum coccineum]
MVLMFLIGTVLKVNNTAVSSDIVQRRELVLLVTPDIEQNTHMKFLVLVSMFLKVSKARIGLLQSGKKDKQLEAKLKSTTERNKGRMLLLQTLQQGERNNQESSEAQLSVLSAAKILADASKERVKIYTRRRSTNSSRDSNARGLFSTAEEVQGKKQISTNEKLDKREETDNIDWNIVAEQVQERQSNTIKRYQTLKKKPVSVAQARKNMMIYLKNMAGYKMGYFKGMSYDEIRPIFEEEYNKIQTLFKKDTEVEKTKTKRIAEETLLQESFKKLRTAEALRVRNITEAYQVFEDMLKGFDREDLVTLWSLVKERFRSAEPTEDKERALWVELKRLFEPDKDDVLWKLQRYMYDPLTWRLYGTCGVHHVSSTRGHDIYMLIEKDYPLSTAVMNLMLSRRLQVEEDSEMARDLIMKIFIEANKPRS